MTNNWFDLLYYAIGSIYIIRRDLFEKICDCEDAVNKIAKDNSIESKNKKSELIINFLKDNGMLSKDVIKALRLWTYNNDNVRKKFQDATQKIYDDLTALDFKDDISKYNEILTRIIRTNGQYLDPNYEWDAEKEDEKNNDYEAQDASELIEGFKNLKNEDVSLRNILDVFYSVPGFNDIKSPDGLDIDLNLLQLIAKRLINTSVIEDDKRRAIVDFFNEIPETDDEFIEKLKSSKNSSEIESVFDFDGIKEALARICSIFINQKNIIVEFVNEELSKKPEFDISGKSEYTKEAFRSNDTLIEWAIEYPEYSLIEDAFKTVTDILKKTSEYVKKVEERAENRYRKYLTSYLYVNHIELTVPECLAKWQGFLRSEIFKNKFSDKLIDDIKQNVAKDIFEKKIDYFGKYLSQEKAVDVISIIRDLNIDEKKGYPTGLFINQVPTYEQKLEQWSALVEYLYDFFNSDFDEKKQLDFANALNKNFYDAACILIYMLTSDKSEKIRIGNKKVVESFGKYSEIMIFEKTILQSSYADFKSFFDKVYKNFMTMKIGFEDFIKAIVKSYNEIAEEPEKPSAE